MSPVCQARVSLSLQRRSAASPAVRRRIAYRACRGRARTHRVAHGSITIRPQPANPPVSRVAMLAPTASAVAAISASNFSIGLPAWRRTSTMSGYRAAARASKDPPGEILREHCLGRGNQCHAPSALGQGANTIEDFCLIDIRGVKLSAGLRSHPRQNRRMRFATHQLRDDIGVDDDHGSNEGGASTNSEGGNSRSTPPSGAKRRRIASAKLGSG